MEAPKLRQTKTKFRCGDCAIHPDPTLVQRRGHPVQQPRRQGYLARNFFMCRMKDLLHDCCLSAKGAQRHSMAESLSEPLYAQLKVMSSYAYFAGTSYSRYSGMIAPMAQSTIESDMMCRILHEAVRSCVAVVGA